MTFELCEFGQSREVFFGIALRVGGEYDGISEPWVSRSLLCFEMRLDLHVKCHLSTPDFNQKWDTNQIF